jgi:hypothetical protein
MNLDVSNDRIPLVSLYQGDYARELKPAASLVPRFLLERRAGRIGRWWPWRRAASRAGAEGLAEARVREHGDSVAVVDTRPDGAGEARVEFSPNFREPGRPLRVALTETGAAR